LKKKAPPLLAGSGNVIGHLVVKGVPYINGKRARLDRPKRDKKLELLDGAFSVYRCPECDARLSGKDMICLNACHLSAASFKRFMSLMGEAKAAADREMAREKALEEGKLSIVDAMAEIEQENDPARWTPARPRRNRTQ
jgi:hypothetical protein